MNLINCPFCGPRQEDEFTYGGEYNTVRPNESADLKSWETYLFYFTNNCGLEEERWCHTFGCHQWFKVTRDTKNNTVIGTDKIK